jgi:hypothetical protein
MDDSKHQAIKLVLIEFAVSRFFRIEGDPLSDLEMGVDGRGVELCHASINSSVTHLEVNSQARISDNQKRTMRDALVRKSAASRLGPETQGDR